MPSSYTIGEHFEAMIKELLESGRYASASEVIRDGLRLLEEQEQLHQIRLEQLREDIRKGQEGPFEPLNIDDIISEATQRKAGRDAA